MFVCVCVSVSFWLSALASSPKSLSLSSDNLHRRRFRLHALTNAATILIYYFDIFFPTMIPIILAIAAIATNLVESVKDPFPVFFVFAFPPFWSFSNSCLIFV